MKKLFTLFATMMLSVAALQASVTTVSIDLSGMTPLYSTDDATVSGGTITGAKAWRGGRLVFNPVKTGASEYDYIVLAVADHAQKVLFKVEYSDNSSVQKELPVGTDTAVISITQDEIKTIYVINWSETSNVSITVNNIYLCKTFRDISEKTIWDEGKTFVNLDWNSRIVLSASQLDDLHVWDMLEINCTPDNTEYDHLLKLHLEYNSSIDLKFLAGDIDGSNQLTITADPTTFRFPIYSPTDVANIKAQGGLCLYGQHVTVNSVKLYHQDVLWAGTNKVTDWGGGLSVLASKLTGLAEKDTICVRVDTIYNVADKTNQVFCSYKSDWTGAFDPSFNYVFTAEDKLAVPVIAKLPVTATMLTQLNGEQLNFGGVYYHMTDIYIVKDAGGATAIDEISQSQRQCQKLIKNGQLFIIRDDKTYTLQGQRVQ